MISKPRLLLTRSNRLKVLVHGWKALKTGCSSLIQPNRW